MIIPILLCCVIVFFCINSSLLIIRQQCRCDYLTVTPAEKRQLTLTTKYNDDYTATTTTKTKTSFKNESYICDHGKTNRTHSLTNNSSAFEQHRLRVLYRK
jgi:hypothetical protein